MAFESFYLLIVAVVLAAIALWAIRLFKLPEIFSNIVLVAAVVFVSVWLLRLLPTLF